MALTTAVTPERLTVLYRGPLSSCNYACGYCPFAKRQESDEQLAEDRAALERFLAWAASRPVAELSVLFTPWGEALVRPWYQEALVRLTGMAHVRRAAIQSNLACRLDWVSRCDRSRLGLWTTFHPSETSRRRFVEKCEQLSALGVAYSVGVVGLREHAEEIAALRRELPASVYVWVNAYKRVADYYAEEDIRRIEAVDPLFRLNTVRHPSRGRPCRTGHSVVSVDGHGTMRRCHFIPTVIGDLYAENWADALAERPGTNDTCGCHIGYVHMPELRLYEAFGDGVLERIPTSHQRLPAPTEG